MIGFLAFSRVVVPGRLFRQLIFWNLACVSGVKFTEVV